MAHDVSRVSVGDEVAVLPSGTTTKVKSIDQIKKGKLTHIETAEAPQSVTLQLEDEVDASRGDMIVRSANSPVISREVEANLVWFNDEPLDLSKTYLIQHSSRTVKARVTDLRYRIDVDTLDREDAKTLNLNEIGRSHLICSEPLYFDSYDKNRSTGSFILIDSESFMTVAAGMLLNRKTTESAIRGPRIEPRSTNLHKEESKLSREDRELSSGHKAFTLWFTGLSGSGKSTICKQLEKSFFEAGKRVYWLDGDTVRRGLCRDLGFRREERRENLRRIAEVAKLFNDAGVITLCSFITPYHEDQELIKEIVGEEAFRLVYLSANLEVCEGRDPNGLYKKARSGEIKGFTGIDAPYEAPSAPNLNLDTGEKSVEDCIAELLDFASKL